MKKIASLIVFTVFLILFPISANASEETGDNDFSELMGEINGEIGGNVDSGVSDILREDGISVQNPENVANIKPENVFSRIWNYFTDGLKKPIVMLGKIIAVSIIGAIIKSVSFEKSSCSQVFGLICIMSVILIITDTVSESFESMKNSIESMNTFMISYVPIFASVTAAGGAAISSGGYSAAMLFLCECMAVVASKILVPFLSVVLAFTLVSAVNPRLQFSGAADSVKKCTVWVLGAIMTVFVGIMALQGMTGGAVDNIAGKTLKFAASSFIPVIGGSVSEAYSAVKGSLGVIKNSVGSVGIIIVFLIVIKPIMAIIGVKFVLWLGKMINDIFCQKETSEFLKSVNSVMSIGLSVMVAYALVFIIATSILMAAAVPGGG